MPRARPKQRVCLDCNTLFKGRPKTPCPSCGTTHNELVLGTQISGPEEPDDGVDDIPVAPTAPPMPNRVAPVTAGGGITPAMLLQGRAALKKTPPKARKPLPGEPNSAIPRGVRVIANEIEGSCVEHVVFRRPCPGAQGLFSLPPIPLYNLRNLLNNIASGRENPGHGNFNSIYQNRGGELPWRSNPLQQQGIRYYEYGWAELVPQNLWKSWLGPDGRAAPKPQVDRLSGFLATDGGRLNTPRLIFSESGEVFFTPDHYLVFFRYSPLLKLWTKYLSPSFRYGSDEWDASVYQTGTRQSNFA